MSIHIIVDGYNFIRQSPQLSLLDQEDLAAGREGLIDMLVAYKKIKAHKITVVFDAYGNLSPGGRERIKGIDVVYSRAGEIADVVINRMARHEREKALVVSSDREVASYASAQAATAVDCQSFSQRLEMAVYMNTKGLDQLEDEDYGWKVTTKKKGPARKLSKKARRDRKRINKL